MDQKKNLTLIGFAALIGASFIMGGSSLVLADTSTATLRQCYEWAKIQNEDLKIKSEDIRRSEFQGREALGGALPDIKWKFNETWQEPAGVKALEAKGFGGFAEKEQKESKFVIEQPIFSGLREFSAWSGAKRIRAKNALLFERASLQLYEQVASVFYAILDSESDRDNTQSALKLSQDRVKELRGFGRLGKARKSEIFTAEARAAALKADLDRIQSDIHSAREELSYLTGQDLSTTSLIDEIANPPVVLDLVEALNQAMNRTDIQAQKEDIEAQKRTVRYERGDYWPNVDLTGNYYTKRATFLSDIDWDVVLSVDMPLFKGGAVSARVKQALSALKQSRLKLDAMERFVNYAVKKLHGELKAANQEALSLEEATNAAQQSYDALLDEYRLGLVTNLDVLEALDFLLAQKRSADTARLKAKRLFIQLNIAMEKMP